MDDDKPARFIYEVIGQRYGFDVVAVDDCESAVAAIAANQFDLILMDWRLPGTDGMECVRVIRNDKRNKTTPIIAVTAQAMAGDREKCLAAGCNDYLSKPFEIDELKSKVNLWTDQSAQFWRNQRIS